MLGKVLIQRKFYRTRGSLNKHLLRIFQNEKKKEQIGGLPTKNGNHGSPLRPLHGGGKEEEKRTLGPQAGRGNFPSFMKSLADVLTNK